MISWLGNVDHLLHHVQFAADAVEIGNDHAEAGGQRLVVAAEPFDGVVVALRHLANAHHDGDEDEQHEAMANTLNPASIGMRIIPLPEKSSDRRAARAYGTGLFYRLRGRKTIGR